MDKRLISSFLICAVLSLCVGCGGGSDASSSQASAQSVVSKAQPVSSASSRAVSSSASSSQTESQVTSSDAQRVKFSKSTAVSGLVNRNNIMDYINFGESNSLDIIIDDMLTFKHEGNPHGIPGYSWYDTTEFGVDPTNDFYQYLIAWGQVYRDAGGSDSVNTAVQLRNLKLYVLYKSTGKWELAQGSSGKIGGAAFLETFANNETDYSVQIKNQQANGGGISVNLYGHDGYNYHFWPSEDKYLKRESEDIAALYVTMQSRLLIDDVNGADDRDKARFILGVGGDVWAITKDANGNEKSVNTDFCIGRHKFVTKDWRAFNAWWTPDKTSDALEKNPPPLS